MITAPRQGHHLQGILHASGLLADATVSNQTLASLRAVFAPKVVPVQGWLESIGLQPTALQVLFSSVASMLGAPGQVNYGTANAWLDSAAQAATQQVWAVLSCSVDGCFLLIPTDISAFLCRA